MFDVSLGADLLIRDSATFDALVRPMLSPEQVADVMGIVEERATADAVKAAEKFLIPGVDSDVSTLFVRDLLALAGDVESLVQVKEGAWSGRVIRIATPNGTLKVTLGSK